MAPDGPGCSCAVAIGASAGGVPAVLTILAAMPADLPAAVFVVLHLAPRAISLLPSLVAAVTPLSVADVRQEPRVCAGTVYVAVPDRHVIVGDGHVRLVLSPPLHYARPSVDVLFESIAAGWGDRAIGVILTGNGTDGAAGIRAIKNGGGCTIAQDPRDAEYGGMPRAAVATGCVDTVLPLAAVARAIVGAVAAATPVR